MSQGAEKSQLPEVGIQSGLQDLKVNSLPSRCKSRSGLNTYSYYTIPSFE